jgi:hypothetical protein
MTIKRAAEDHLAASIVYLCALRADRPRFIDGYIDYYGETPRCTRDGEAGRPHTAGAVGRDSRTTGRP